MMGEVEFISVSLHQKLDAPAQDSGLYNGSSGEGELIYALSDPKLSLLSITEAFLSILISQRW